MKETKWARRLNRDLLDEIFALDPKSVNFIIDRKKGTTTCHLVTNTKKEYCGVSVCSILDKYDEIEGKNKSLGRAFAAYKKKINSLPIRTSWNKFPETWTKRQIERVLKVPVPFKSYVTGN